MTPLPFDAEEIAQELVDAPRYAAILSALTAAYAAGLAAGRAERLEPHRLTCRHCGRKGDTDVCSERCRAAIREEERRG